MSLPPVQGWLIDYRTARAIFSSQSNVQINHCLAKCTAGEMHVCHQEEHLFRQDNYLVGPFIEDQFCVFEPDDDVYDRCPGVRDAVCGKPLLDRGDVPVFLTAIALAKQFGVISSHTSPSFATVHDLCALFGVPVLTAQQYFALA